MRASASALQLACQVPLRQSKEPGRNQGTSQADLVLDLSLFDWPFPIGCISAHYLRRSRHTDQFHPHQVRGMGRREWRTPEGELVIMGEGGERGERVKTQNKESVKHIKPSSSPPHPSGPPSRYASTMDDQLSRPDMRRRRRRRVRITI